MRKIQLLYLLFPLIGLFAACKSKPVAVGDSFGAGISKPESSVAFADVVSQLETNDSVNVIMRAKVLEVCQDRGCWMNLVDPITSSDASVFVKFKNYGFFVPKDIAGHEVLVEGKAFTAQTSVKELRHYAADAGKSKDEIAAITEPVMEKKFMATGVLLLK